MNVNVVTASRREQKFSEAPANMIVVSAETIEQRGYQTLTEVFEDFPGFDFTTTTIPFGGKGIQITADVKIDGWVNVSIVDKDGNKTLTAATVIKTVTDKELWFNDNINLDEVRLQFELSDAKLYSFKLIN